ncbi:DMP19 family protein [Variovorax sp. W6]|uniref:DMP19 family protein n=1 Tax=Variovorax sp. W6 TaxID=3093895 RepID=UPI003D8022EF
MRILTSDDVVVVSQESLADSDASAVIESNVSFVNALRSEYLRQEEISRNAWLSYYADYYLRQVENGGFSQFLYNSKRAEPGMTFVRQGLDAIGARRHLALLKEGESLADSLGSRIRKFFSSGYFGKNTERDRLDVITERFYRLNETENIEQLNAAWLKSNPKLLAIPHAAMREQVELRARALPDRGQREAAARDSEHVWMKNIRAVCAAADQQLIRLNAGSGYMHEGKTVFAHHFSTDKGHHFMIEVDGQSMLFDGTTKQRILALPSISDS